MLRLTFLGTSAGVPTKQRNVTALAIESLSAGCDSTAKSAARKSCPWILIDCGEGTQQQLLHTKLSLHQLSAICITHVHGDHCYGLAGLLASAAMSVRTAPLTIIAPKAIAKLLDTLTLTTELYFPFIIDFMAIEDVLAQQKGKVVLSSEWFGSSKTLEIDITPLSHRVPSHAFGITQIIYHRTLNTDKLMAAGIAASGVWGKLQRGEDVLTDDGHPLASADYVDSDTQRTRVVVAGDNDTPACLTDALQNTDLLVHEATYTAEVLARIQTKQAGFDPMHSSAQKIGKYAQDIGLPHLILTHFSARYQSFDNPNSRTPNMGHIRVEVQSHYQGDLWLAADFAQYKVTGAAASIDKKTTGQVEYLGSARTSKV